MEELTRQLWAAIKALNLKGGDPLPLTQIAEKFLKDTEYHPDEVVEAFEELAAMGWLKEEGDGAILTQAGFISKDAPDTDPGV